MASSTHDRGVALEYPIATERTSSRPTTISTAPMMVIFFLLFFTFAAFMMR